MNVQTTVRPDKAELQRLEHALDGSAVDLVLSDMAPNISGIASADQSRAVGLAELAIDFASKHLKPHGNLLVKTFHGAGYEDLVETLRRTFLQVHTRKPEASRSRRDAPGYCRSGLCGTTGTRVNGCRIDRERQPRAGGTFLRNERTQRLDGPDSR